MSAPLPPGLIVRVPDAELERAELVPAENEQKKKFDLVPGTTDTAAAHAESTSNGANSDTYRVPFDVGDRGASAADAERTFRLKVKMQKHVNAAKANVRANRRAADVEGLARDVKLHPEMVEDEIKSLGSLFDEYADEDGSGHLYISRVAVKRMLDEALEFMYSKIDMDRSGILDKVEIKALLTSLGHATTNAEVEQVMADLDHDNSGNVDFREFKRWWDQRQFETQENQERELKDLFAAVDKDGSGHIDWHEFLQMIACVPTGLSISSCLSHARTVSAPCLQPPRVAILTFCFVVVSAGIN